MTQKLKGCSLQNALALSTNDSWPSPWSVLIHFASLEKLQIPVQSAAHLHFTFLSHNRPLSSVRPKSYPNLYHFKPQGCWRGSQMVCTRTISLYCLHKVLRSSSALLVVWGPCLDCIRTALTKWPCYCFSIRIMMRNSYKSVTILTDYIIINGSNISNALF